jgi:hypothetical protein
MGFVGEKSPLTPGTLSHLPQSYLEALCGDECGEVVGISNLVHH